MKAGYTDGLLRLATRCCGFWSYQDAADNLEKFCKIHLSRTTVGDLAGKTTEELSVKIANSPVFREAFQKAKGANFMPMALVSVLATLVVK